MGQKVSPIGLRLGINKTWESSWYANKRDFATYLIKDIQIREILEKKLKDSAVSSIEIQRNKKRTEIIINTAKPGMVIGQKGENIDKLKKELKILTGDDMQISIKEVRDMNMSAKLVADSIAFQVSNRASFRATQKRAIRNTMRSGAKGIKTLLSGRLGGAEIARTEGYTEGTIPLHTLRADIDYGFSEANTTYGKIGVKVWIYKGEILPDKKKGGNSNVNAKEDKIS